MHRWEDIIVDPKEIVVCVDWIQLARDGIHWRFFLALELTFDFYKMR
jgi:Ethanolamine utilization protein EutJ (predicted chaperonin)